MNWLANCLSVVFSLLVSVTMQQNLYEVVHVTSYIRHGARTTWLNTLNFSFTQELGQGNLTANGLRMLYVLGAQLKNDYSKLLDLERVNWNQVEVYSSSLGRAVESAYSVLLGAFPLGVGDTVSVAQTSSRVLPPFKNLTVSFTNESSLPLGFKPFPMNVNSPEIDLMFIPSFGSTCPDANSYTNRENLKLHNQYNNLVFGLSDEIKEAGWDPEPLFNQKNWTIDKIALLYDEMKSYQNYYGRHHPKMNEQLFRKLFQVANINFNFLYPDEKITRLFSDGVARKILAGLVTVANKTKPSPVRFRLFSGHDTGMYAHMLLMGMTSLDCNIDWFKRGSSHMSGCEVLPDFASSFIYEVSKRSGAFFVRVLYNGKSVQICDRVQDDNYCWIEEFVNKYKKMMFYEYGDLYDFCGTTYYKSYKQVSDGTNKILTTLLLAFSAGFLALLGCLILLWSKEEAIKNYLRPKLMSPISHSPARSRINPSQLIESPEPKPKVDTEPKSK